MKRLKVLFLPPPPHGKEPWEQDVTEAMTPRHDLLLYDPDLPLAPQFESVDVVIDFGGSMGTREMADASGGVKLWQVLGNGIDHFDLEYWRSKNISVANCPGELTGIPLAECAVMFMLMLSRRWHEAQRNLKSGRLYEPLGLELHGKVLGIVGFGYSGRELARRSAAFGMHIRAIDIREIGANEKREFGIEFAGAPEQLDQVIPAVDFLSLHLHLTEQTQHILDERRIRLMKPTAYLINVSRGALVDQQALYRCLQEGQPAGAGMDVFSPEPVSPDNPLLHLPNVVATNHISGNTDATSRRRAMFAATNVDRIAAGLQPLGLLERRSDVSMYRPLVSPELETVHADNS